MAPVTLEEQIKKKAAELGFDSVGICSAQLPEKTSNSLHEFIAKGLHGDMAWLADRAAQRQNPTSLWPDANSVIAIGVNYGPDRDPMANLTSPSVGVISVYAQNKDYHDLIKKRLKRLARWFCEETGTDVKVFVDTAPVMEKPLAQKAGIGWQGKHTNLVSREFGSWLFLGAIFTTAKLIPDDAETDHCGGCRRCIDVCPTNAFLAPYKLDARKCISYLTIEHKGPIPRELRKGIGNRIYGCDDCLSVCPWNKFASLSNEAAFHAKENLKQPSLRELALLNDENFRQFFAGSPIKRTGRNRFVRNVLFAIGNSGNESNIDILETLISDDDPLVRGAAIWALGQTVSAMSFAEYRDRHLPNEQDQSVEKEWRTPGTQVPTAS